jgi:hypothetical protein
VNPLVLVVDDEADYPRAVCLTRPTFPRLDNKLHISCSFLIKTTVKRTRAETQPAACLLAKPTQLNINLSSDRFAMFNKERDISFPDYLIA